MGAAGWFLVQPHSMLPTARNGSVIAAADAVAEPSVALVTLTSLRGASTLDPDSDVAAGERGDALMPR